MYLSEPKHKPLVLKINPLRKTQEFVYFWAQIYNPPFRVSRIIFYDYPQEIIIRKSRVPSYFLRVFFSTERKMDTVRSRFSTVMEDIRRYVFSILFCGKFYESTEQFIRDYLQIIPF